MATASARVEVALDGVSLAAMEELSATLKAGQRNSAADVARLRKLRQQLREAATIISELGIAEDEEQADGESDASTKVKTDGEANPVRNFPPADDDEEANKALSLDRMVGAVSDAVSKLNRGMYDSKPYEEWCQVAACYADYVIIREGLAHFKVGFTISDARVELAPRIEWEVVEPTWAAVSSDGGETKGIEPELLVKAMGQGRLGHYAVLWGDKKQRDLYGEFFTSKTADLDSIFKTIGKLPLLYHHGMDRRLRSTVVGVVDTMKPDDIGLWVESQLDMANAYSAAIERMASKAKLGTSSGTLPGVRDVDPATGEIKRWTIAEVSLTPSPAEPRLRREMPVQVLKSHYETAGLALPEPLQSDIGAEEARPNEVELERERLRLLLVAA